MRIRKLLFKLLAFCNRGTTVIQSKSVDLLLEFRHLLNLVSNLILIVRLILGRLQAFFLEVDDFGILVLQLFKSVNLLIDFVLNHVLDILEQVVDRIFGIIEVKAYSVHRVIRKATERVDVVECLGITVIRQIEHCKLRVDGTPLTFGQVGRCG